MSKTRKSLVLSVSVLLGALLGNNASGQTLDEVLRRTLETSPDLLSKAAERFQVDGSRRVAYAGYFPSFDASVAYGRDQNDNATTRASNGGSLTLTRRETAITLSQMLFDGFAVVSNIESNEAKVNSAAKDVHATMENLLLRTVEVYLEVLRHTSIVAYAKENLASHQATYQQIQLRAESGLAKKADLDQATGRLALARTNLLEAQANLRDAGTNFVRITGFELEAPVRPEVAQEILPATEESALALALRNNSNLQKAQLDIVAARADKRQAMAAYYPKLNLDVATTNKNNTDGSEEKSDSLSVMLKMSYNIFRGGADRAREKSASWAIEKAKETYNTAHRQVEQSMRISWNAYTNSHAQLGFRKEHAESAQRTRDAYKEQFVLGQRTLLDLLDSENELYSSRASYISAQFTELLGRYRVLYGINRLVQNFGIVSPDAAKYKPSNWIDGF